MHIKSVTLSNFRSFKQQPEIHPFSPEMNCVVGRNGSGKSNLFDAVQFVLGCPKFWSLRTVSVVFGLLLFLCNYYLPVLLPVLVNFGWCKVVLFDVEVGAVLPVRLCFFLGGSTCHGDIS